MERSRFIRTFNINASDNDDIHAEAAHTHTNACSQFDINFVKFPMDMAQNFHFGDILEARTKGQTSMTMIWHTSSMADNWWTIECVLLSLPIETRTHMDLVRPKAF